MQEVDGYFAYDYSNVDSDMSKMDKYAEELQIESEKAQKLVRTVLSRYRDTGQIIYTVPNSGHLPLVFNSEHAKSSRNIITNY